MDRLYIEEFESSRHVYVSDKNSASLTQTRTYKTPVCLAGYVRPIGVYYAEVLAGADGAEIHLFFPPRLSKTEHDAVKRKFRNSRDVVRFVTYTLKTGESENASE